jgi:hypothetical protein
MGVKVNSEEVKDAPPVSPASITALCRRSYLMAGPMNAAATVDSPAADRKTTSEVDSPWHPPVLAEPAQTLAMPATTPSPVALVLFKRSIT